MPFESDVKLEKSIVIDPITAKRLEESGKILESDGFLDRFDGEKSMPISSTNAVDAETAMRLAAQQGISLPAIGTPIIPTGGEGKNLAKSRMPGPILESFRHQPPMAPSAPTTEFNPEFLSKVKDANQRMNTVLGESNMRQHQAPSRPAPTPVVSEKSYYNSSATPAASVDYPLIRMIVTEAVTEALQRIDLAEMIREVIKEGKEKTTSKAVNENVIIKLGETVLAGKVTRLEQPKKN